MEPNPSSRAAVTERADNYVSVEHEAFWTLTQALIERVRFLAMNPHTAKKSDTVEHDLPAALAAANARAELPPETSAPSSIASPAHRPVEVRRAWPLAVLALVG